MQRIQEQSKDKSNVVAFSALIGLARGLVGKLHYFNMQIGFPLE